jgi:hypothetical protein
VREEPTHPPSTEREPTGLRGLQGTDASIGSSRLSENESRTAQDGIIAPAPPKREEGVEAGKCADFFSIDLNTVDYAGALQDPVAATVFCAPQKARYTVINGCVVAEKGQAVTVDMAPVIEAHNRFARQFAEKA